MPAEAKKEVDRKEELKMDENQNARKFRVVTSQGVSLICSKMDCGIVRSIQQMAFFVTS